MSTSASGKRRFRRADWANIGRFPRPCHVHGQLIDKLAKDAGAVLPEAHQATATHKPAAALPSYDAALARGEAPETAFAKSAVMPVPQALPGTGDQETRTGDL